MYMYIHVHMHVHIHVHISVLGFVLVVYSLYLVTGFGLAASIVTWC